MSGAAAQDPDGRPTVGVLSCRCRSYPDAVTAPTCDFCGRAPADGEDGVLPLTWTTSVENGRSKTFCETCSREHLRAIESKLDSAWW